jgi:hypothetical protein
MSPSPKMIWAEPPCTSITHSKLAGTAGPAAICAFWGAAAAAFAVGSGAAGAAAFAVAALAAARLLPAFVPDPQPAREASAMAAMLSLIMILSPEKRRSMRRRTRLLEQRDGAPEIEGAGC